MRAKQGCTNCRSVRNNSKTGSVGLYKRCSLHFEHKQESETCFTPKQVYDHYELSLSFDQRSAGEWFVDEPNQTITRASVRFKVNTRVKYIQLKM